MPIKEKNLPESCHECGQKKTYTVHLSRGHVILLRLFASGVGKKGINLIVPSKEMIGPGAVTSRQATVTEIKALSQARLHGLLAISQVKGQEGNWLLTTKGAEFLRGKPVPRTAIVLKRNGKDKHHNIGYWETETNVVTAQELLRETDYWAPIDFTIVESRVVKDLPPKEKSEQTSKLF